MMTQPTTTMEDTPDMKRHKITSTITKPKREQEKLARNETVTKEESVTDSGRVMRTLERLPISDTMSNMTLRMQQNERKKTLGGEHQDWDPRSLEAERVSVKPTTLEKEQELTTGLARTDLWEQDDLLSHESNQETDRTDLRLTPESIAVTNDNTLSHEKDGKTDEDFSKTPPKETIETDSEVDLFESSEEDSVDQYENFPPLEKLDSKAMYDWEVHWITEDITEELIQSGYNDQLRRVYWESRMEALQLFKIQEDKKLLITEGPWTTWSPPEMDKMVWKRSHSFGEIAVDHRGRQIIIDWRESLSWQVEYTQKRLGFMHDQGKPTKLVGHCELKRYFGFIDNQGRATIADRLARYGETPDPECLPLEQQMTIPDDFSLPPRGFLFPRPSHPPLHLPQAIQTGDMGRLDQKPQELKFDTL